MSAILICIRPSLSFIHFPRVLLPFIRHFLLQSAYNSAFSVVFLPGRGGGGEGKKWRSGRALNDKKEK